MDAADVERLSLLVERKGWKAFNGKLRGVNESTEDVLIKFLSKMTAPQKLLTMDLMEEYFIIKDYTDPAIDLLREICARTNSPLKIAPVKVKGTEKVKSGDALLYEMDCNQNVVEDRDIKFSNDPYSPNFWDSDTTKILVDDFIGTGEQFKEMINSLKADGINPQIDYVATLVIQQAGLEKIQDLGIQVIALHTRPKALEALAQKSGRDLAEIRRIYLEIEEKTSCISNLRFGYLRSEATVTMKRTPDNTLPIFWHEGDRGWPAPFLRKTK